VTELWHVSEDGDIARFEPRADPSHDSPDALVWATDTEHVPAYWFPRECPRGTFWAVGSTSDEDVERFLGGDRRLRVHALEWGWFEGFVGARVHAYRLPPATFEPYGRAAGYWVSRAPVEPLEVRVLDDLPGLHRSAGIELRLVPDLLALWDRVASSTLEFSGIRLRNLSRGQSPEHGRSA
jgi:hypothetical protein